MNEIRAFIEGFLKKENGDLNLLGKSLKIIVIFIIINIAVSIIGKVIDKVLNDKRLSNLNSSGRRANTLGQILKKLVKYLLYFIGIVISLEMFNINTTSIIATAGIGGLAIGFGAQSLVKDLITGFFIILEDQYAVGDFVKIGNFEGTVEDLGLRVTKLRDFSGELHIIPNSSIQIVTNKTRGASRALVEIAISYDENIDKVVKVLEEVCGEVNKNNDNIVEGPIILGITNLGEYDIKITIVARTKPMEQWSVERELRKRIKEAFEKENIEKPYPRRIVFGGKEHDS